MGALSKRINFPLGALEAEAKAAECGLICAWELGLREVIIKGDSQVVIMLCLQSTCPFINPATHLGDKDMVAKFQILEGTFCTKGL